MAIESLTVRQVLRPLRCALLVDNDPATILRAVALNTVTWGGLVNPILRNTEPEKAKGLIDEFDPDLLVSLVAAPSDAITSQFKDRVVAHDELVEVDERTARRGFQFAFEMLPVYTSIGEPGSGYPRPGTRAAFVVNNVADWRAYTSFTFGTFDGLPDVSANYESAHRKLTRAVELTFDPDKGLERYINILPPLEATIHGLTIASGGGALHSHVVFVGSHQSFADLIEFWNVRATGRMVWFLPIGKHQAHEVPVRHLLELADYPLNAQIRNQATILKGSSVDETEFQKVREWVTGLTTHGATYQVHAPRFGLRIEGYSGDIHAGAVNGERGREFAILEGQRATPVNLVWPSTLRAGALGYRWATEIGMQGAYFDNDMIVRPPRTPSVEEVTGRHLHAMRGESRISDRGIVLMPKNGHGTGFLSPLRTGDVFSALFKDAGLSIKQSQPGRHAEQVIRKMGQLHFDCRLFKIKGARSVINKLSRGGTLTQKEIADIAMKGRDEHGDNWKADLYKDLYLRSSAKPGFIDMFETMLEKQVIRPGYTFTCENCNSKSWYHVSEFGEEYKCRFCFASQRVRFSRVKEWQYKADGLFQHRDSAYGSVAVIAALWRLMESGDLSDSRYITSHELEEIGGPWRGEVDYAVLTTDTYRPEFTLILGEARGFVDYSAQDVDKLRTIAKRFPLQPVVAFSTLKPEYSADEKRLLNALIADGLEVIALTRWELDPYDLFDRFAGTPFPHAADWREFAKNTAFLNLRDEARQETKA